MLDTAGQEEYSCMQALYVSSGSGFLMVYDVTGRYSFTEARDLYSWLVRLKGQENTFAVGLATSFKEQIVLFVACD